MSEICIITVTDKNDYFHKITTIFLNYDRDVKQHSCVCDRISTNSNTFQYCHLQYRCNTFAHIRDGNNTCVLMRIPAYCK
jgi:hypothetical protein